MALQIMSGTLHGAGRDTEILYDYNDPQINITDTLKPICDDFFKERTFLEGDEEITVSIVPFNGVKHLSDRIKNEALRRLFSNMNTVGTNTDGANTSGIDARLAGEVVEERQSKSLMRQLIRLISMRSYIVSELIRKPFSSNKIIRIKCSINSRNGRRINIPLLRSKNHDKKSNQYIQAVYNYLDQETMAYLDKINESEIKNALKDFMLFQSLIISMLLKPNPHRCVLTII